MKIKNSVDWTHIELQLKSQLKQINYNPDLVKLLSNISIMVNKLSKQEVECRRINNFSQCENTLTEINETINRLEKLIIIGKLMS